jgi:phosphoribosylamine-glycine ligase
MNFHLLSDCGDGCGLLERIQDEGNQCTVDIQDKNYKNSFDGILEKSNKPPKDAIIIVDTSGMGKTADEYRKRGFKVFGGSVFADKLEEERDFGLAFMRRHGIQFPETKVFRYFTEAIDWIQNQKEDEKFVFKPNGRDLPCKLTYCGEDRDDLLSYLRFVQRHFTSKIDDFVLQSFVEGPIVSTEFWVGPEGFIYPPNHTVEVKKFLNDNLGPSTGCQGNLVWIAEDDEITGLLENIEEDLMREGFQGPIDLNAILSDRGIRGLEWTPRFGLDAMPTLLHLLDQDIGQLIADIVNNQTREMKLHDVIAGGIRISIPPYPIEPTTDVRKVLDESPNVGVPIKGLDNVYFYEVMMLDGQLVHSPGTGVLGVVVDCAEDPEDVLIMPYEALDNAKIPDKQYRTDLSSVLPDMCREACEALCGITQD